MIRLMKRSVCTLAILLVTGCLGISPSTLKPAVNQPDLNLATALTYEYSGYGVQWKITLAAGPYRAFRQDDGGTYYLGESQCFSLMLLKSPGSQQYVNKVYQTADCGFYLPAASSALPQLFTLQGSEVPYRPDGKPESAQHSNGDSTEAARVALQTAPGASPLQVGVGAGLGSAIGHAMLDSQKGNIRFHWALPPEPTLRKWLQSATRS